MANLTGTNLVAPTVPFTTEDKYPTHYAKYGNGGWRSVSTYAELVSIPLERLEEGMAAYCLENNKIYIYLNETWTMLSIGEGGGTSDVGTDIQIDDIYGLREQLSNISYNADQALGIANNLYNSIGNFSKNQITSLTYEELVYFKQNGFLTPGHQYRIIDYTATTIDPETRSAGHRFDIIVTANSFYEIDENARACQNDQGESYFKNCNLEKWKIKYSLDNNDLIYTWAQKKRTGVNVDFDQTLIPTDLISDNSTKYEGYPYHYEIRLVEGGQEIAYIFYAKSASGDNIECIFDMELNKEVVQSAPMTFNLTPINQENGKGVIYHMIDEWGNEAPYDFKNIQFKRYKINDDNYNDLILKYIHKSSRIRVDENDFLWFYTFSTSIPEEWSDGSLTNYVRNNIIKRSMGQLNNGVIIGTSEITNCFVDENNSSFTVSNSYDWKTGKNNINWICDDYCRNWQTGDGNNNFICKNNSSYWKTGINCESWICGEFCNYWSCGNNCYSWETKNNCCNWKCGDYCNLWTCGAASSYWSCGYGCSVWECGSYNSYWTCGNSCSNWTTEYNCTSWTCGNSCSEWSTGSNCIEWSCGNDCTNWHCGDTCDRWSCGNYCSSWTAGSNCSRWRCGNSCYNWTAGSNNTDWSCGNYCSLWTTANHCSYWSAGNNCSNWKATANETHAFNIYNNTGGFNIPAITTNAIQIAMNGKGEIIMWEMSELAAEHNIY